LLTGSLALSFVRLYIHSSTKAAPS
jgi:hypothetical protein